MLCKHEIHTFPLFDSGSLFLHIEHVHKIKRTLGIALAQGPSDLLWIMASVSLLPYSTPAKSRRDYKRPLF
jgi:hypothetical protein